MKRKLLKKEVSIVAIIVFFLVIAFLSFYCLKTNQEIALNYSSILNILIHQENKVDEDIKDELDEDETDPEDSSEDDSEEEIYVCKNAFLEIESAGLYYSSEGDQLGVGPLPPKVDIQTNYWIFWRVDGFNKNLSDLNISAQLSENTVWMDNKSLLAGKLQFGQVSRRVIWKVDEIKQSGNYRVGFEIGVIPEENNIGEVMDLLTNIKYEAFDKECQKKIEGTLGNITTDLKKDALASDKGKVESD